VGERAGGHPARHPCRALPGAQRRRREGPQGPVPRIDPGADAAGERGSELLRRWREPETAAPRRGRDFVVLRTTALRAKLVGQVGLTSDFYCGLNCLDSWRLVGR
jgi:hypothetical protein